MKLQAISLVLLFMVNTASAQPDTLSIELSSFTKRIQGTEWLYIGVFLTSLTDDTIILDDSRRWAHCINAIGVKLIQEVLTGDCYRESDRSECHPGYGIDETELLPKFRILYPHQEYSYAIQGIPLTLLSSRNKKSEILYNTTPYRFRLYLPYKIRNQKYSIYSKRWVYYYPK
jgi:hypothetical protein